MRARLSSERGVTAGGLITPADDGLMDHVDELHRQLKAGELETHTHEEVLERLQRFGIRRPLADEARDPGR